MKSAVKWGIGVVSAMALIVGAMYAKEWIDKKRKPKVVAPATK